ncbi:14-3-3-like protein 2 [Teleopsis dalmanni]|uniref:14-3-3-like protein 2 n=1 Tax=Teleopsis dalmanni TaxID=139649 RepID=UPI0018CE3C8E|nr:14-3-3-like protein 2 [Teleopsis dalmanni]
MDERNQIRLKVEYADYTQNYEDMVVALKQLVKLDPRLSNDEIFYLSVAYEAILAQKEKGLSELSSTSPYSYHEIRKARNNYKNLCIEFLYMINLQLLPNAVSSYQEMMLYRLLGEYNYNLVNNEDEDDEARNVYIKAANDNLKKGFKMARQNLGHANPLRLALACKFADFKYKILHEYDIALDILEDEYSAAFPLMTSLSEEVLKSVTVYMEAIEHNIQVWVDERYASMSEKLDN